MKQKYHFFLRFLKSLTTLRFLVHLQFLHCGTTHDSNLNIQLILLFITKTLIRTDVKIETNLYKKHAN